VIPKWLPRVLLALAALLALRALLWFQLLKPTIESQAKEAGTDKPPRTLVTRRRNICRS
jgi:hypothetical protein